MGLRAAARSYGIPTTTLKDRLDRKNKHATEYKKALGRPTTLPPNIEEELVKHILDSEAVFLGLTREMLMSLAFVLVVDLEKCKSTNPLTNAVIKPWLDSPDLGK